MPRRRIRFANAVENRPGCLFLRFSWRTLSRHTSLHSSCSGSCAHKVSFGRRLLCGPLCIVCFLCVYSSFPTKSRTDTQRAAETTNQSSLCKACSERCRCYRRPEYVSNQKPFQDLREHALKVGPTRSRDTPRPLR